MLSEPGRTPVNLCSLLSNYFHVSLIHHHHHVLDHHHLSMARHASTYTISLLRRHAAGVILQLLSDLLRGLLEVALTSQLGLYLCRLRAL